MKICSNHQEYQVPLIQTMSWNYAEFWCPYCDAHEGFLGAGINVKETEKLINRLNIYEEKTREYRHAFGVLVCCEIEFNGNRIKPQDLPEEEKQRLSEIRKKIFIGIKAEDLKNDR